jgi:hypothetical protein
MFRVDEEQGVCEMKRYSLLISLLLLPLIAQSCIFRSDPLAPNSPPVLEVYEPDEMYITLVIPNGMTFRVQATDPDSDHLEYCFVINGEVVNDLDSLYFHPLEAGIYEIDATVSDASSSVTRHWFVTVSDVPNEPPVISNPKPEQQSFACAVGDTLRFSFSVNNEPGQPLQYSYELDGEVIASNLPSSDFELRFFEIGEHGLEGIVYDNEFWDTTSWHITVVGFPDTIPPSMIYDLSGRPGEIMGSVHLSWTAPGDDGTTGTVSSYHVRTSTYPIYTEEDWANAAGKLGEPTPSPFGTPEEMTVTGLIPGTYIYVAIRAQDDFFNWSPLGNCVHVQVRGTDFEGYVIDACSGDPIEGHIISGASRSTTSDQEGYYKLENLPFDLKSLTCRDEGILGEIGEYFNLVQPVVIQSLVNHLDLLMVPAVELVDVETDRYLDRFYLFLRGMTATEGVNGKPTVLKSWNHYPIRVYSPPMFLDELDLQAAALGALDEWEAMTGFDLFVIEDDPDLADVRIVYYDGIDSKHHVETISLNPDGTPALKDVVIYLDNTSVPLFRFSHLVFAHEFGHVLCLDHSMDSGHLMLGLALPTQRHVTTDEANVLKVIYHVPPIYDFENFIEE